jgi:hypothetical protein
MSWPFDTEEDSTLGNSFPIGAKEKSQMRYESKPGPLHLEGILIL